ncbi:MAG: hypothetical protein JZU64_03165 [Rhodoferax sp.]|jgi:ABC-type uncharacterized transport system substrate-binding protein|nr:hypothetical protein [Rhodoferax sp.]
MQQVRRLLLLGCLPGWAMWGETQAGVRSGDEAVLIVSSDSAAAFVDAAQALTEELLHAGISRYAIPQMTAAEWAASSKSGQAPQAQVLVALGTEAATLLATTVTKTPVLCALLPRSSFERVLRGSGRKPSSLLTALYLDQPLSRQLALIRLALPAAQRIGVLWGPESVARAPLLKSLAAAQGLTLAEAKMDSAEGVFPALKQVLGDCDVLLALPDPQVYHGSSIQNILLSAFRAGVPMVGFSPAYVRAGALLGLHVTPVQVGRQAASLVLEALQDRALPASPVESNDFEVGVNDHVARAMGLALNASNLRLALRRAERLP